MKFLLDQGLPRTACALLIAHGINAVHVGDLGMSKADDEEIVQRGIKDEFVVATLDADFHRLLALSRRTKPSIIRIRIEGLKGPELARVLIGVAEKCADELNGGAVVSVEPGRIRIHRLPLQ